MNTSSAIPSEVLEALSPPPSFPPNSCPFDDIEPIELCHPNAANFAFGLGEWQSHFELARKLPASYFDDAFAVRDRARRFSDEVIRKVATYIDQRTAHDHCYFAWDVMRAACEHRFFSMLIPQAFEGLGLSSLHMAIMAEELAVGCAGLASTIGVHSAGVSCGMLSMDPYILEKFIRPVARAEKAGKPILWAGAVTEPNAGTDIWDEEFLDQGRIGTAARKVSGGYVLNGTKCFISNGSVAEFCIVAAALDLRHVRDSWTIFLVPMETKGVSVGRIEKKMGQRASPAAEIILEDVFVPTAQRVGSEGHGARYVSIYLAGSRGPVGAIGTGIARRSLECLIEWARAKKTARGRLIDQQAVQLVIARMAKQIVEARQSYFHSAVACDRFLQDILGSRLVKSSLRLLPSQLVLAEAGRAVVQSAPVRRLMNQLLQQSCTDDRLAAVSALAAIAKCKGADTGVAVSSEASRMMGPDATDPRWPVEKCWRDAKLNQIYEGTNQANTITLFKDAARTWGREANHVHA